MKSPDASITGTGILDSSDDVIVIPPSYALQNAYERFELRATYAAFAASSVSKCRTCLLDLDRSRKEAVT